MTVLPLAAEFLSKVRSGEKVSTVRRGMRPYAPGPAILRAGANTIKVSIVRVQHATLANLTDRDAQEDGFADRRELVAALRRFYPDIVESEPVTIVKFSQP